MIKNIIFDFDGVVIDSVSTKTEAFRLLFEDHPCRLVDDFIEYHLINGGVSRYEKIRYFYEKLLHQEITKERVNLLALKFSEITRNELSKPKYLFRDVWQFLFSSHNAFNLHVASGADEKDLKYICQNLGLDKFFKSIKGSPSVKDEVVHSIIQDNSYLRRETCLIGDSVTDKKAADENGIKFLGYNYSGNPSDVLQINDFKKIKNFL